MSTRTALLRRLGDGNFHSGSALGRELGVSGAAVHKGVRALTQMGIDVQSVRGRGYRLRADVRPLCAAAIERRLDAARSPGGVHPRVVVLDDVDSTNSHLREALAGARARGQACLAERQSAGRGRRGRPWVASPYRNIMLSVAWDFDGGFADVMGLSLAGGVAVVRALARLGARGLGLKWPNDVVWRGRKLAGLLAEIGGEVSGPCRAVLGIGVNVDVCAPHGAAIDQPWVDLRALLADPPDRNVLAAALIDEVTKAFGEFERCGFGGFHDAWRGYDVLAGSPVTVMGVRDVSGGTALGVDASGALLLRDGAQRIRRLTGGEVSLRVRA